MNRSSLRLRFSVSLLMAEALLFSSGSLAAINCPVDKDNRYESIVKIIRKVPDGDRHCTGTVLSGGCYILTAGHCVVTNGQKARPNAFKIKAGVESETSLDGVSEVFVPSGFKEFKGNDVGILKLKKCIPEKGMEIDFGPLGAERDVIVGGYGVTVLNSFLSQPVRHMGNNRIGSFDEKQICLEKVLVDSDGKTLLKGSGCLPTGQDSGSPILQAGKIIGVFVSSDQRWLRDGTTESKKCAVNVRDPVIKAFIEDVIHQSTGSSTKTPTERRSYRKAQ